MASKRAKKKARNKAEEKARQAAGAGASAQAPARGSAQASGKPSDEAGAQERRACVAEAARRVLEEDSALASKMEASFFGPEGRQSALAVLDKEARLVAEHCFSEWLISWVPCEGDLPFGAEARRYAESLFGTRLTVCEVQEVSGQEVLVMDLIGAQDKAFWLDLGSACLGLVRWDIVGLRLLERDGGFHVSDGVLRFSRPAGMRLHVAISDEFKRDAKRKHRTPTDWIVDCLATQMWLIGEGEGLKRLATCSEAPVAVPETLPAWRPYVNVYSVGSWPSLEAVLAQSQDIEKAGSTRWIWRVSAGMGREVPVALLERRGDMLEVAGATAGLRRAVSFMLWQRARGNAKYDTTEEVQDQARRRAFCELLDAPAKAGPEVRAATFLVRHYLELLYKEHPCFGKRTAGNAIFLKSVRERVILHLKAWENEELKCRRPELSAPLDLGFMWERLGIGRWSAAVAAEVARGPQKDTAAGTVPAGSTAPAAGAPADASLLEKLEAQSAGYQPACVLGAMAELDLATAVLANGGSLTATRAAWLLACDARGMEQLLDALCALGYFAKEGAGAAARYSVAQGFERLLDSRDPSSYIPMLRHRACIQRSWSRLSWAVRDGLPQKGRESFLGPEQDGASFIMAMNAIAIRLAEETVDALDKAGVFRRLGPCFRLIDIGGASGTYTEAFLRRLPEASAALFDLPAGIEAARRRFAGSSMEGRVELIEGDFTKRGFPLGFHLAWISAIIHQMSRQECRDLYAKAYAALEPGGLVAVRDFVMDASRTSPAAGALFGVNMLVQTGGGRVFTFEEIREDLEAAGFADVRLAVDKPSMSAVVTAAKPA